MDEQENQLCEYAVPDMREFPAANTAAERDSAAIQQQGNWEGYSLEILSVWFDP